MSNPRVTQAAFYEADVEFHAALVAASGKSAVEAGDTSIIAALLRQHLEFYGS